MAATVCCDGLRKNLTDATEESSCFVEGDSAEGHFPRVAWQIGAADGDSPMDDDEEDEEIEGEAAGCGVHRSSSGERCFVVPSSSLQSMLSVIVEERCKSGGSPAARPVSEEGESAGLSAEELWTKLFSRHFVDSSDDASKDDMLFYIRKNRSKSKFRIPQTELEVFRKASQSKPSLSDREIDWEETVYLNLIMQHFEYYVTCGVCSRTGDRELQVLKKLTQRVYASPSRRKMDSKGTEEEITYPNIFFTIDNFEEAFADQIVRDSELICVELVARDRSGVLQGVIFVSTVRYDVLKRVYDARASLTHRMAQRMSLGWFKDHKRVEYVRVRGPLGKGHAELAISRVKGSGPDTPLQTPNAENIPDCGFEENEYSHRRMSDPSSSWNYFLRGSLKRSGVRKSRSETEDVDTVGVDGCAEVEAGSIGDEFDDNVDHYNGFVGNSFGQAWHFYKEQRRACSVALHSFLTCITLPWHRIVADLLEVRQPPIFSYEVL